LRGIVYRQGAVTANLNAVTKPKNDVGWRMLGEWQPGRFLIGRDLPGAMSAISTTLIF
jgi:hypothetical protein